MKKIIIIIFATVFATPFCSFSQNFKFDTTNCNFKKASTDTSNHIVEIIIKTKNTPKNEILECKNAILSYSFSKTEIEDDGEENIHILSIPMMKLPVIKIKSLEINLLFFSLRKNQYKVDLEEFVKFDKLTGWFIDQKKTLGFKMENLILK